MAKKLMTNPARRAFLSAAVAGGVTSALTRHALTVKSTTQISLKRLWIILK